MEDKKRFVSMHIHFLSSLSLAFLFCFSGPMQALPAPDGRTDGGIHCRQEGQIPADTPGIWGASPDDTDRPDGRILADTARIWSLEEVVRHACTYSPDALSARHSFRASYWSWRSYKADYLPAVTLLSDPNLDRSINKVTLPDGSVKFVEQNVLNTDLSLNLSQNIPWTGGSIFLESSLLRMDLLSDHSYAWKSVPLNLGYRQSIFGYNSLKWNRRIEPLRYEEACKTYLEAMELVAACAVDKFFALATAQSNLLTAASNYAHADTLYRYAHGRYEIGTITENEMLQLEINRLNEETNRLNARIEVEDCMQDLRSYLALPDEAALSVRLDAELPDFRVDESMALVLAGRYSPDVVSMVRRKLEARSAVAQAKANTGLKADLYLRFGLTQTADGLGDAYRRLLDQQSVSIGISLPLLDWGRGKGRVRVARSNQDLVDTRVDQERSDFLQNVSKLVGQFNLQNLRVQVSLRTDSTARRRSEVARRLYLLGKSTVLDLNASISEKDAARRNFVSALHRYWSLYYMLRSITLYDFRLGRPIEIDYRRLIEDNPR